MTDTPSPARTQSSRRRIPCLPSPEQRSDKLLRNRMRICLLAVCLMWATSLRVAVYITSFFIGVPSFDLVVKSCKNSYQITKDEKMRYADCVDAQLGRCNLDLDESTVKEARRVNVSTAKNGNTVAAAKRIQSDCAAAYTSLRRSLESWTGAGHSVPINNSTCKAEERDEIMSTVGDIKAVRSEAFSISTDYSGESQATVRRLVDYAEARAKYDIEYMGNHTRWVHDKLDGFVDDIDVPVLDMSGIFDDIQADVESLVSCVSPRNVEMGRCLPYKGAQERLADIRQEVNDRMEIYKQEIASWRQKVEEYKANVLKAYKISSQFYWGIKSIIPDFVERPIKADWYTVSVTEFLPTEVTFPSSTPTFSELPSLDSVWASVSSSLEFFSVKLHGAKNDAARLVNEFRDGLGQQLTIKKPNLTPEDYNPPQYVGSSDAITDLADEESVHMEKSKAFVERTAVALDAFSELTQKFGADYGIQDARSLLNVSSVKNELSTVDISFESLTRPSMDFDLWFLRLNSLGDVMYLLDFFFRLYSTFRLIVKYWSVSALKMPNIDLRTKRQSRNPLKMSTAKLVTLLITSPAMGLFFLLMVGSWLVSIASALYVPLYREYLSGCVPHEGNGTFVTGNLFSIAYNHAYQDASSALVEGLDGLNTERGQICSSLYATSATTFNDDSSILSTLARAHKTTSDQMSLMKKCIDADTLDMAFREACCGYNNMNGYEYAPCSSQNILNRTCPLDELVNPPTPFAPPGQHLASETCNVNMSLPSWTVEDAVFQCSELATCDITCRGPNRLKVKAVTRECGCMLEWFLHSLWLKTMLSLFIYALMNASRIGFVEGLARIFWARLHPGTFTVLTSCKQDGAIIAQQVKRNKKDEEGSDTTTSYIKSEIDRKVRMFQVSGFGLILCAGFANFLWMWVLGSATTSATPLWLK